ncbi:MAG: PQQ-binding-like beta-propeller repeat protein [Acidobacteriota bacterium]
MVKQAPWYRSTSVLCAAALLLPPLGIVLLWMHRDIRVSRKILNSIYLLILTSLYLYYLLGLRVETDGTGRSLMVSLFNRQWHESALERDRAQQKKAFDTQEQVESTSVNPLQTETRPSEVPTLRPDAVGTSMPKQSSQSKVVAEDWPDFRGARRDGSYRWSAIRTQWPESGLPPLWKQPVGGGYASFVAVGDTAYTIEQRRRNEVVVAYDIKSGKELWSHGWAAEFRETMGGDGPRATPTWDQGRLYALGAIGELRCLDARTGKRLWSRNILEDNQAQNLQWGMSAAPLIVDDKVVVLPGGPNGKSVVAYNKLTGSPVWSVLDDKQGYASPMLVTLAGSHQILVVSARRAMGLEPTAGDLLWEYPWVTSYDVNAAQPLILGDNRVFLSAGYGHGAAVVEISRQNGSFTTRTVWQNTRMKNKFTSSVLHGGYIYGLDEAILACMDAATGDLKWKGGRYGYGQLILAGEHLVILSETGDLVLVKAAPEGHREMARFSAIDGKTWNHPAMARGRLLVRNTTEMACFDLRVE